MRTVVVVLSVMRASPEVIRKTVLGIQSVVSGVQIILSMNDRSGSEFWRRAEEVASESENVWVCVTTKQPYKAIDRTRVCQQALEGDGSALIYLHGYELALQLGAEAVVEMDLGGSMNWRDVPKFVEALAHTDAALSTRSSAEGGKLVNAPIQRRLLSWGGTWLSRAFLHLNSEASDMTAGFEGFSATWLRKLLETLPAEQWLCVSEDAAHLFQTEIRAYAHWTGCSISWIPIVFGEGKPGRPIKDWKYLWRCFRGFAKLTARRSGFRK